MGAPVGNSRKARPLRRRWGNQGIGKPLIHINNHPAFMVKLAGKLTFPGETMKKARLALLAAAAASAFAALPAAAVDNPWMVRVRALYLEPADKAFPKKTDVDANYDLLVKIMIDASMAAGSPTVSEA